MVPHRYAAERANRRYAEERGEAGKPVRIEKAGANAREQRVKAREHGGADDLLIRDLGAVLKDRLFADGLHDQIRAEREENERAEKVPQPLRHGIVGSEARQRAEKPPDLHCHDLGRTEDETVRGDAAAANFTEHRALTHGGAEHVQRYAQAENQNFPISHSRSPLFLLTPPLY